MRRFPYDPTTGRRLTHGGFNINPISPMTQEEVDRQCNFISGCTREQESDYEIEFDSEQFRPY